MAHARFHIRFIVGSCMYPTWPTHGSFMIHTWVINCVCMVRTGLIRVPWLRRTWYADRSHIVHYPAINGTLWVHAWLVDRSYMVC